VTRPGGFTAVQPDRAFGREGRLLESARDPSLNFVRDTPKSSRLVVPVHVAVKAHVKVNVNDNAYVGYFEDWSGDRNAMEAST
jgi:hypothetical protein